MSNLTGKFIVGGIAIAAAAVLAGSALAAAPSQATAAKAAAKAPAGTVMIGDFSGTIKQDPKYGPYIVNGKAAFGWGWATSTDQVMGGHSVVNISLIHPGADGTKSALRITGEIKSGFMVPWAGAFWYAGPEPMQPGNLSGKTELSFRAKGTPGRYSILVLAGSGYVPESTTFAVTPKWKEYHISLAKSFPNADWTQVMYLGFSGGQFKSGEKPGKFRLDVDQVSLH